MEKRNWDLLLTASNSTMQLEDTEKRTIEPKPSQQQ